MSIRGTVGSLIESHRAKGSRPDRRNFTPQTRRLWTARICPRFGTGRHVSQSESGDVSPHSKLRRCQFLKRLPQLRSTVPNSPPAVPNFQTTIPNFPATFPNAKATVPNFRMAVPNFTAIFPNFSASLPNFRRVFPNFPATFPNFSTAAIICNDLFPSHLCGFSKNKVGRVTPCAPFSRNPAPARRGLTRPASGFLTLNHQLPTTKQLQTD